MKKLFDFLKNEIVLVVAMLLAIVSMFIVTPDAQYIDYIDFRTLGILFCLMAVMAGLQDIGIFREIAEALLSKVNKLWQIIMILVMLCFFFSMLITNDVALITFVPFTFIILGLLGEETEKKLIIPVVVMQTIAANLGSMLTPIGNPQNLYLYGKAGMGIGEFIRILLPYSLVSFVLLAGYCLYLGRSSSGDGKTDNKGTSTYETAGDEAGDSQTVAMIQFTHMTEKTHLKGAKNRWIAYVILFLLCLLVVANILDYRVVLIITLIYLLCLERAMLTKIDYSLLLTFVGFFVFIGNMGRVPAFRGLLQSIIEGNEMLTAVVASQVISNVPAALLLSGFTDNIEALILGANLGGLGTLIASMASLISYKYIVKENKCSKGAYFGFFTLANVVFLVILLGVWILLSI